MSRVFGSSRPLILAHRGGAALAPENTLAAFDAGMALGADGLELDVRLSRDGIAVVHHDRTLDRTTDHRGDVAGFTADELARVDAGYRFADGEARPFRGRGLGVPTLASVLARYRDCPIVVEMKGNRLELARAVVETIQRADAVDRVCLGAFNRRVLRAARTLGPQIVTSAAREEVRWALYRTWFGLPVPRAPAYAGFQVPEIAGATRVVSPRFLRAAHRAGLAVQVWTVNDEHAAARLLDWGVDALITDRPDTLVPLCRSRC